MCVSGTAGTRGGCVCACVRDWKSSAGPGATRSDHRLGWKWVPKGLQTVLLDPRPSFPTWTEARSLRLNGQGPPSLRLGAAGSTRGPLGRAGAPHPCVQECRVAQACRSPPRRYSPGPSGNGRPRPNDRPGRPPFPSSLPFLSRHHREGAHPASCPPPPRPRAPWREQRPLPPRDRLPPRPPPPSSAGANRRAAAARSPRKPGPSLRPHACALERNGLSGRGREKRAERCIAVEVVKVDEGEPK